MTSRRGKKHPKTRVRIKRIANRLKRQHPEMKPSLAHAIARGRVKNRHAKDHKYEDD